MLNLNINTDQAFYYRKAMNFRLFKINHPELKKCFHAIWLQVLSKYKLDAKRLRNLDERRKACFHILNNLFKAQYLTLNPWVGYSRDKNQYSKDNYRGRMKLKYASFVGTVNYLRRLGFISHKDKVHYPGNSYSSRMKANNDLIRIFDSLNLNNLVNIYKAPKELDIINLKDENKNDVPYKVSKEIKRMRDNLIIINSKNNASRIALDMTDEQYHELIVKLNKDKYRTDSFPDFTAKTLHRVFNNSSFKQGGRFYGGWWQSIPKEFRKFITINYKPTEEVDFSGHHLRILYAINNIEYNEVDPYEVEDKGRNTRELRSDRKLATLIMLNCFDETKAKYTIQSLGISKVYKIMDEILQTHEPIKDFFFKGLGNRLMNEDSNIAEKIMIKMIKLGHTILPIHDSFIVRNSAASELETLMKEEFEKYYKNISIPTFKPNSLEGIKSTLNNLDLDNYLSNRNIVNTLWDIT